MAGGPRDRLLPRRDVRLGPPFLNHEARDRGAEEPATAQIEPARVPRVEAGAVRIPRAGDVDDLTRRDRGDVDLAVRGDDRAPLRAAGHDDDLDPLEEGRGALPSNEAQGPFHLGLVPEEELRATQETPERRGRVDVVNLLGG